MIWLEGLYVYFFVFVIALVVDIILGLAVAIREYTFDWLKLASFHLEDVVPKLIGWVAISFLGHFASPKLLGEPLGPQVSSGLTAVLWGAIMFTLGGYILVKVGKLGIDQVNRIPGINSG